MNLFRKQKEASRGVQAERIMNDPVIVEALEKIEQHITEQWRKEPDDKVRERLWYTLQGSITFRELMTNIIATGKSAAKEVQKHHQENRGKS